MRDQVGLFTVGWVMGFLQGCGTAQVPNIDATFWAGDSLKEGISRSQENQTISCKTPQFDEYVCVTYTDLQKIYSALLKCE